MCTDIDGGETFREEILANVRDAKVFLIFLNEKWARSDECVFEYNYATVRHKLSTPPPRGGALTDKKDWGTRRKFLK